LTSGGGSDAPSWRKTQEAGKEVIAGKSGEKDDVTSPAKVREERSAGDLAKRALFMEGKGGEQVVEKEKVQAGSPVQGLGQEEKGKEVVAAVPTDVNSALQGMHVDYILNDPGREGASEEEKKRKRGTYKRVERGVQSRKQGKEARAVGQKRGADALSVDMVLDGGVVEESAVEGDAKKLKKVGLANQSCETQ